MGRTPVGPLSITTASQRLMVKASLRWVNVYLTIRKEEAHHKQEYRGQHGQGDNELLSASLPPCLGHSQCSLEPGWWAGELNALSQVALHSSTEKNCLHIQNERERINSKNIWTIYSNTLWIVLEAGGQRAVVENGQWRDGEDSQAVQWVFCHRLPKWLWFTEGPIDN